MSIGSILIQFIRDLKTKEPTCGSCARNCSLEHPRCRNGEDKALMWRAHQKRKAERLAKKKERKR